VYEVGILVVNNHEIRVATGGKGRKTACLLRLDLARNVVDGDEDGVGAVWCWCWLRVGVRVGDDGRQDGGL
jgi:hypothetical protein